jgi:hypothetical protein
LGWLPRRTIEGALPRFSKELLKRQLLWGCLLPVSELIDFKEPGFLQMEYDEETRYLKVNAFIRQEENLVKAKVMRFADLGKMQTVYSE